MKSILSTFSARCGETILLAPRRGRIPSRFRFVQSNAELHQTLLTSVQRFRGQVYLQDGAIDGDELTADGRHDLPVDPLSWHVLTVDGDGEVRACLRFLDEGEASHFDHLWIRHAAIANCPVWGRRTRQAVEEEMKRARRERLRFGEVGGWAISAERRFTVEGIRTVLATCGLLQLLGGCVGVATATKRHGSAPILRRMGMQPLAWGHDEVPAYFEPRHGCEMEVLRYDSRVPHPRYLGWVEQLREFLLTAPVIADPRPWLPNSAAASMPGSAWIPLPALAGAY